jgi:CheY-like chemotaxis protein
MQPPSVKSVTWVWPVWQENVDSDDGVAAIRALRELFGRSIPAILATARSKPEVRDEASREDILVMHKPLRPTPLRAQLTRYGAMREAAE